MCARRIKGGGGSGRQLTPKLAARIKWLAQTTELAQDQIAAKVDLNQGRVSEVLSGKRFPEVEAGP
jgi:predicted XRE-type DNA-binding protein